MVGKYREEEGTRDTFFCPAIKKKERKRADMQRITNIKISFVSRLTSLRRCCVATFRRKDLQDVARRPPPRKIQLGKTRSIYNLADEKRPISSNMVSNAQTNINPATSCASFSVQSILPLETLSCTLHIYNVVHILLSG